MLKPDNLDEWTEHVRAHTVGSEVSFRELQERDKTPEAAATRVEHMLQWMHRAVVGAAKAKGAAAMSASRYLAGSQLDVHWPQDSRLGQS